QMSTGKKLTFKIVIGMVLGIVLGLILNFAGLEGFVKSFFLEGIIEVGGRIFLSSLKLLVVPMVFVSLVCGTGALEDIKKLGRLGIKTFSFYVLTTALAITIALIVATVIDPGSGFQVASSASQNFVTDEAPPLIDVIANIFPSNPVDAMAR